MKNLALAFCSIRPSQYPDNVCDNREKEYLRSLKQLQRVLPKSFDLLVCENTIDDAGQSYIAPRQRGCIILFDSRTPHRVLKVTKGTRRSIVGWVVGKRWR